MSLDTSTLECEHIRISIPLLKTSFCEERKNLFSTYVEIYETFLLPLVVTTTTPCKATRLLPVLVYLSRLRVGIIQSETGYASLKSHLPAAHRVLGMKGSCV